MLSEQPTNEAAEALQQVIDSLSDGQEALVRPLESKPLWQWQDELNAKHNAKGSIRIVQPFSAADYQCQDEGLELLPDEQITDLDGNSNYIVYHRSQGASERDPATQLLNRRVSDLTLKVACSVHGLGDRNIARIREELDELRQELATERTERQGEIDVLTSRFLSEIAEIKAAQSVDGCEIATAQADIRSLQDRIDELEESFEPAPIKIQVARFALLFVAVAGLFVGFGTGKLQASASPDGWAFLAVPGIALLMHQKLKD